LDPEPPSLYLLLDILQPFQLNYITLLVVLLILLMASALVSGSEIAFFSLKSSAIDGLEQDHPKSYKQLTDLLDRPKTLLATILISNNFINVGIVILSSYLTNQMFDFSAQPTLGFLTQVIAITFLILLFGEVLPKVYATRNSIAFSSFMSGPMLTLRTIFLPASRILVRSTSLIEKRLKGTAQNLSVDDLSQALELTTDDSTSKDEQKILEGIVKFGSTNVRQIMKPRMDVVSLDYSWDYHKVMSVILDSGYSRIPVYEENFDKIKGVLYIKDLLQHIGKDKDFKWQDLLWEPFYVPENKKIDDLLKEFQHKKIHLAIVVDEFGGTSGIITLEDVIEEIVGEISDEFDDEELVYSKLDERNYVFEGKIHLTDFIKILDIGDNTLNKASGDSDTLAGFLLEIAGKFPDTNEVIDFEGYRFKVESKDGRRIKRIKVTLPESEDNEEVA
jgi:putative hemolysin